MTYWSFACPDWVDRMKRGAVPIADLPLDRARADRAVGVFDHLRLPDLAGHPALADAAGDWFRDGFVRPAFGGFDECGQRRVREIFGLVPKKNSKTTYSAALGLTAMLLNDRPNAEMQIIAPRQEISDICFSQMAGMIAADPDDPLTGRAYLQDRFHVQDHLKRIMCRATGARMKVKTFDMKIVTGSIPVLTILDEIHLLSQFADAARVIEQIRGGMDARPEALMLMITTQSDTPPAGVFRDELAYARKVRDGEIADQVRTLPVLYELPQDLQVDHSDPKAKPWRDTSLWPMVMPNLGRPITIDDMIASHAKARADGPEAEVRWASQRLNVEIGIGLNADSWRGAKLWPASAPRLALDDMLARCEVVTAGVDGGGLDDLMALALIGRDRDTQAWIGWVRAWAQPEALGRRPDIADTLRGFAADGDLVICDDPMQDVQDIAGVLSDVSMRGLFPVEYGIGLDPYGIAALVDELAEVGLGQPLVASVGQGTKLSPAIWGLERKLGDGSFLTCGQGLLTWSVGNAKAIQRGNAVLITKEVAGRSKIDPLMAILNAAMLMQRRPMAARAAASPWNDPDFSIRKTA